MKIIAGIISFVSFTEYNVSGKALSLDNLSISQAELDKLASKSLTDDYIFQLDVDEVHKPYCECVGRECNEWGKWFGSLVPFLQSHMTPKGCYHSLSWGGEKYRAVENDPVMYTSKWLSSHLDSVVYTMGYDHIRYYLIHQLIVYAVDGHDYPMAICSFIPTESAETDCFSNHDVLVEDVWNKESIFVISLYRLRTRPVGKWYGEQCIFSLSPMRCGIFQFMEMDRDALFHKLRERIQQTFHCLPFTDSVPDS